VSALSGRILHLQRYSTEDGPGIRTTVFFKGCPLHCSWCHNPESISPIPQIQWLEMHCIACNTCLKSCPKGGLQRGTDGTLHIDRKVCDGCGACVTACPSGALELLGRTIGVEELVAEVIKDRSFYTMSGGGVTASGGEPGLQPEFVGAFLQQVKAVGIATALDTCGLVSRSGLESILPYVDLILYDLKEIDTLRHRVFTGQGNERILETLLSLRDIQKIAPHLRLWIRTPLIPGATATRENISGIGNFLSKNMNGALERWELCAFNNLCRDKYHRLGLHWEYMEIPLLSSESLDGLLATARSSGVDPNIIYSSGATRPA
jgi:pyruvate formate lyase activating enzyme